MSDLAAVQQQLAQEEKRAEELRLEIIKAAVARDALERQVAELQKQALEAKGADRDAKDELALKAAIARLKQPAATESKVGVLAGPNEKQTVVMPAHNDKAVKQHTVFTATGAPGTIFFRDVGLRHTVTTPDNKLSEVSETGVLTYLGANIQDIMAQGHDAHYVAASLFNSACSKHDKAYRMGWATPEEFIAFKEEYAAATETNPRMRGLLKGYFTGMPRNIDPMTALSELLLRTAHSDNLESNKNYDATNLDGLRNSAIRSYALAPVLGAMILWHKRGKDINQFPFPDLQPGTPAWADFMQEYGGARLMARLDGIDINGKVGEMKVKAVNGDHITQMIHSPDNLSSFTALTVMSGQPSEYQKVAAAHALALSTPLHGGANSEVTIYIRAALARTPEELQKMTPAEILSIDQDDAAKIIKDHGPYTPAEIEDRLVAYIEVVKAWNKSHPNADEKVKLFGIGHGFYQELDPRSVGMKEIMKQLMEVTGEPDPVMQAAMTVEYLVEVKGILKDVNPKLHPNVDTYTGPTDSYLGLPFDQNTVWFERARLAGAAADVIWNRQNMLNRPRSDYEGEQPGLQPFDVALKTLDVDALKAAFSADRADAPDATAVSSAELFRHQANKIAQQRIDAARAA